MEKSNRVGRAVRIMLPLLLLGLLAGAAFSQQAVAIEADSAEPAMKEFFAVKATGEQPQAGVAAIENAPKQIGGFKSKYGLLMSDGKLYPCNKKGKKLGKHWKVGSTITYIFVAANVKKYNGSWTVSYKSAKKLSHPINYKIKTINFLTKRGKSGVRSIGKNGIDCTVKKLINFNKTRVTKIGAGAFANSAVTKIALPKTLKSIGAEAFYSTTKLKKVSGLSKTKVTKIPREAFRGSAITSIAFPSTLKKIDYAAFAQCNNLAKIGGFPSTQVSALGDYAFNSCPKLTAVSLPKTCKTLGAATFNSCSSLKSVKIPSTTVISAPPQAFGFTPFDGGTAGAHIYVPASLLDAYKANTTWGYYYSDSFAAIS